MQAKGNKKGKNPQVYFQEEIEPIKVGECLIKKVKEYQQTQAKYPSISLSYSKDLSELRVFSDSKHMREYEKKNFDRQQQKSLESYQNLPLMHSDNCSAFQLQTMCEKSQNFTIELPKSPMRLAACGLVMDSNQNVLITKRSNGLKTFPNCWVLPGGRVDPNETILEAMKREIQEEVGINMRNKNKKKNYIDSENSSYIQPLCVYQSISPQKLEHGFPQYQNLVVFFAVQIFKYQYNELKLSLCINEVEMASWVQLQILRDIYLNNGEEPSNSKTIQAQFKSSQIDIALQLLYGRYPNKFGEGIGEAHEKAILALLKDVYNNKWFLHAQTMQQKYVSSNQSSSSNNNLSYNQLEMKGGNNQNSGSSNKMDLEEQIQQQKQSKIEQIELEDE